jgi:hypothetical protein
VLSVALGEAEYDYGDRGFKNMKRDDDVSPDSTKSGSSSRGSSSSSSSNDIEPKKLWSGGKWTKKEWDDWHNDHDDHDDHDNDKRHNDHDKRHNSDTTSIPELPTVLANANLSAEAAWKLGVQYGRSAWSL